MEATMRSVPLWVTLLMLTQLSYAQKSDSDSQVLQANKNRVSITVDQIPSVAIFQMPVGQSAARNLDLLTIAAFGNFSYPKIRFNENGDNIAQPNEWFVATAFDRNRWLNNGWNNEPSLSDASLYNDYSRDGLADFHPGEDWNATTGGDTDLGEPIFAVADGIVLFNGCGYGNTVILAHRLLGGEIATSFYGHMESASPYVVGQFVSRGSIIGHIGKTTGSKCRYDPKFSAHLHFEVRRGSMVKVDPNTRIVSLTYPASMWPASSFSVNGDNGYAFILQNYYPPSEFLSARKLACFYEVTGTANLQLWGSTLGAYSPEIAERFTPIQTVALQRVNHRIIPAGTPIDSVVLFVYSGGTTPSGGSLIAGPVVISANQLSSDLSTYTSFVLPTPVQLISGSTYWFVFGRTASAADAYYSGYVTPPSDSQSQGWAIDPTGPGWIPTVNLATGNGSQWSLQLCSQ